MNTTKIFLVLVFSDWNPDWREEFLLMDEEQGVNTIAEAGIASFPYKRERWLFFELTQPLLAKQIAALEEEKQLGVYKEFFVCQETTGDDGSTQRTMIATPALSNYWMMK
jgi:hypothetical protein